MGNVEGRVISATSLNAPKDAKKAFEKGQDAIKRKKFDEATKNMQKAVEVYPKYAAAWFDLGRLQERENNIDEAKKSYRSAIASDTRYIQPWLALSEIAVREKNWEDVAETTGKALKLDPFSYARAYFYNSVANFNLKKYDDAEKSAREAVKLDSKHEFPKAEHLLGILLAERRDYTAAAQQMRNYLKFAPGAQDAATVRTQLAEIEKMASGGTAQAQPGQAQQ
jgi:tetratricopeptide (TPR) repeat protein